MTEPQPCKNTAVYNHRMMVLKLLYQQSLDNSSNCDVTLHIGNFITMKAHWCVLMKNHFFKLLYNERKKDSISGPVSLNFGHPQVTKDAITFLYTGEVNLTLDNLENMLTVADYLQLSPLTLCCSHFIADNFNQENCVEIMLLCSSFELPHYEMVHRFVTGHLRQLMRGTDLLQLSPSSLLSWLSDDSLSYVRREEFFRLIVRWTEHDLENRESYFAQLFCALDLCLIPSDVFTNTIVPHPMVAKSKTCQLHCKESKLKGLLDAVPGITNMRDVIIVGGGFHKAQKPHSTVYPASFNSLVYAYIVYENRWMQLPDLPYGIGKPIMTITDKGMLLVMETYAVTSFDVKTVLCYCTHSENWTLLKVHYPYKPLNFLFKVHAILSCHGRVFFVTSGLIKCQLLDQRSRDDHQHEESSPHQTCYCVQLMELDMDTGNLRVKCDLALSTYDPKVHAVCQQACNRTTFDGGDIFVMVSKCCDNNDINYKKRQTRFLVYDVQRDILKNVIVNELKFERLSFGFPDRFFSTCFGKNTQAFYDHDKMKVVRENYTIVPPPENIGRGTFSSTSVNGDIYIFGGRLRGGKSIATASKYCFATKQWVDLESMPSPLIGAGIARGRLPLSVVSCHSNCPHCEFDGETGYPSCFPSVKDYWFNSMTDWDKYGSGHFEIDPQDWCWV